MKSAIDITEELRQFVENAASLRSAAAELGVSSSKVSETLNNKRRIGRKIIESLGYDPTPHYKRREGADR